MKKVGIVTIWNYDNYGNRLQNYAAQEVLKSLGCQVETIVNAPSKYNSKVNRGSGIDKIKNMSPEDVYKKVIAKVKYRLNKKKYEEFQASKITAFKEFTNKYITKTDYTITKDNIPTNLADEYDFFITGSDQVWNPNFGSVSPNIHFLTFAPVNKRISYAASFGISTIPKDFEETYKQWIFEMGSLSVRENAGAEIIKDLTGREATVLVDPTLMLSKEKWISLSKPAVHKPQKQYLLTYFLGEVSKENLKKIKQIALENKLEIVNLANTKDKARYAADPSEFIDYINSASLFLTDSFHGVVFSILLEKPFIIYNRAGSLPSMYSRIDTLLSTFKLSSRKLSEIKDNADIFKVDYSHIPQILEYERNKATRYLEKALNIEC